jgi:Tol biopolymer transport system component
MLLRISDGLVAPEPPVRLLPDSHFSGPAWTPDGKELILPFGTVHLASLARLRVGENRPRRLEFAGERTWMPTASLRGGRLSFVRVVSDVNIWRHSVGGSGPGATVRWPGSSTYLDHVPRYSPEGRRIAFISNRNGIQSVWVCDADGANAVRLSDLKDEEISDLHWTPDGRRIVAGGSSHGYVFDARNGAMRRAPAAGSVSRDGKWLYFNSKKSGRNEIWKMPFEGGAAVQITRQGGQMGIESVDGRHLYYAKVDGGTSLWRVPVGGGPEEKVLEALMNLLSFDVTGEGIYFIPPARPERRREIQFLRFANGAVETVVELDKEPVSGLTWGLSVSPDRRSILFTQVDQHNSDLMLVENFR